MKFIIAFLTAAIFTSHAQIKHPKTDFYTSERKVYWQHVFEAPNTSKADLLTFANQLFSASRLHINLINTEDSVSFTTDGELVNYKKYGGSEMTVPMILRGEISYRVLIETQDNKYRVTVNEIYFTNPIQPLLKNTIDETISKKGEFRTGNGVWQILNFCHLHFLDKFTKKAPEQSKW